MSGAPLSVRRGASSAADNAALAIVWTREDPDLLGALLLPAPGAGRVFGRGGGGCEPGELLLPLRQRPGSLEPLEPPSSPRISRAQLRLHADGAEGLRVVNIGRCPLRFAGGEVQEATLRPGDLLELQDEMLFLCVRRPAALPPLPRPELRSFPFGEPDACGQVGESPAIWEVRRQTWLLGSQLRTHVLILGASGTGKELAARAIHLHSPQRARKLVSRNAATFPSELIDAELVGNLKHYPNPGMPERPGLVGEADGSSLFLDELGEMSPALQAHLLRVMDSGEYQRLGEATVRRSDFRLIAATNRPPEALKFDILARLKSRLVLPDLNARREDIPLLVGHLMRQHFHQSPELAGPFFRDAPRCRDLRITPPFMRFLIEHPYETNLRELERFLIDAMRESRDRYLDLPPPAISLPAPARSSNGPPAPARAPAASASDPEPDGFTPEEHTRLELLRRHGFSATACGRDPEYPGNRQRSDLQMRRLFSKALCLAEGDILLAARQLSGGADPGLEVRLAERLDLFLHHLRGRAAEEGDRDAGAFQQYLRDEYKSYRRYVLALLGGRP